MDAPDVDRAELELALHHVASVNRWLGGRRALLRHLAWGLGPAGSTVLDVGTGSADLPAAMDDWGRRRDRPLRITAVDLHPTTLDVARRRIRGRPRIEAVCADALRLPFPDAAFDLAVLSMTLHHMDGRALVAILEELARVARGGRVLVSELERSVPSYLGARILATTVWRGSPVTRHDGPVSVLRAFTPAELADLARRAGLRDPRVHRHPLFRLVLRAQPAAHPGGGAT